MGFDGVQDLCSGGLATLTANFFLEKLLVSIMLRREDGLLACSALASILWLVGSSENSTYQAVLGAVCVRLGWGCGRSREAAVLISAGDEKTA